jgi:diacylglycerol kinase
MRNTALGTGKPGINPLRKITIILRGLKFGVLSDMSVAYKLVLSTVILISSFYFHDWIDVMVILVSTALVLTAELFNTAMEAICDFIETARNEKIMIIKDISAAATGISIGAWVLVISYEYYRLAVRYIC